MDDAVLEEQPPRRGHVLTPQRIAVIALVVLAVTLGRFARKVSKHRRRLKHAFTVLRLLRHRRKA